MHDDYSERRGTLRLEAHLSCIKVDLQTKVAFRVFLLGCSAYMLHTVSSMRYLATNELV